MTVNFSSSDYFAEVQRACETEMFETRIHLAHIIDPRTRNLNSLIPDQSAEPEVEHASGWGFEVVALCGFIWIPHYEAKPKSQPACQICTSVAYTIINSIQTQVRKIADARERDQ